MKKLFSCIITIVLTASLALSSFAANVDFVPSISDKPAPDVVVGEIIDSVGETVKDVINGEIIVTPIGKVDTSELISDEDRDTLKEQYEKLTAPDSKLSVICSFLNDIVKQYLGEGKNADNLVIRDFMDISVIGDENLALMGQDGHKVVIKLKNSLEADAFVTTMVYANDEWHSVDTVNNGDGTITCTFHELGAVAILVEGTGGSDVPPPTGSGYETLIWSCVAIASLALIIVFAKMIISGRKHNRAA